MTLKQNMLGYAVTLAIIVVVIALVASNGHWLTALGFGLLAFLVGLPLGLVLELLWRLVTLPFKLLRRS